jgi:hypothetical protein
MTRKNSPEKQQPHHSKDHQQTGGREFGQVIEPTQAQLASGNKGLADDQGKRKPQTSPRNAA